MLIGFSSVPDVIVLAVVVKALLNAIVWLLKHSVLGVTRMFRVTARVFYLVSSRWFF